MRPSDLELKLEQRLAEMRTLVTQHGTRADIVRRYIRRTDSELHGEFAGVAVTYLALVELAEKASYQGAPGTQH